jgi:hypothetical protein
MRSTAKFVAGSLVGLTAPVALVVGLSCLPGCGREKELPSHTPAATESRAGSPEVKPPEKSDDAAKAVVARAVEAHTKGDPARLNRAKIHRITLKGQADAAQGRFAPVTRSAVAEWPDRVRLRYAFDIPMFQPVTFALNGSRAWIQGGGGSPQDLTGNRLDELRWDVAGTYWAAFLLPFVDPAAVVHSPGEETIGGKRLRTVRVARSGFPVWTAGFDPDTGFLVRVSYPGREADLPRKKTLALGDHTSYDGLMLPRSWELFHDDRLTESSKIETLTFLDSVDPKEFSEP